LCSDEQTNIFFGAINKTTYQSYESIIRIGDLSENLDIGNFFKIVCGCFESKPNYTFTFELKSDSIIFYFTVCFDGFYQISQNISLIEKAYSQDKQLSLKIVELESRIEELETKEIILGFDRQSFGKFIKIKTNVEQIDFRPWNSPNFKWYGNVWEFNNFIGLKKIIIDDNQFIYDYNPCQVKTNIDFKLGGCDINSVDRIVSSIPINGSSHYKPSFTHSAQTTVQTQLDNMFDNPQIYLPNVKEIVFHNKSCRDFTSFKFRSLPKLSKVVFEQYENNRINTFNFIKQNKITHVVYNNCLNIDELELIKNYFETNNFTLQIIKK
jgi:hypothetical protein